MLEMRRSAQVEEAAGHGPWTLREPLGREWKDELLHFSAQWAPGEQPDPRLVLATAKSQLPTQLTEVACHRDGSLAEATVWCRVSLDPEESVTLTLRPGDSPAFAGAPTWREVDGQYEAGNGQLTVQVPMSGTYPAASAPGPITAMRVGDGPWLGHGSLQASGNMLIRTMLCEEGALFVSWRMEAYYERQVLATFDCTLYAGEDFVRVEETTSYDSDMAFSFNCFPGLKPNYLLTKGGGETYPQILQAIDYGRDEEIGIIDFNSGHHQMSLTWAGLYNDAADMLIGAIELHGDRWTHLSTNRLHLRVSPPDAVTITAPLPGGYKEYALVCAPASDYLKEQTSKAPNRFCQLHSRYSGLPLQKVKDWITEWPQERGRPFLQCDPEDIDKARARVQGNPDMLRAYQAWAETAMAGQHTTGSRASSLTTCWVALGDDSYAHEAVQALQTEIRTAVDTLWNEGGLMRLIIFHGRAMKMWLQAYDILHGAGFLDAEADRVIRRDLAFLAYAISDHEFFPLYWNLADFNDPENFFLGLGQRIGDANCPPNFHTEYFTTSGMMGCCFPSHPHARQWREEAAWQFDRQLEMHYYDSGAYCESPNYHTHSFVMLNQMAISLRRAGGPDFFDHPRFKAQFDYFCKLQTPPVLLNDDARKLFRPWAMLDPDRERYAMLPGNGNTGHNCSDQYLPLELAVGASLYRESDPELSARCMTTWRRGGRFIANHYDDLTFLLLADPDLPGTEKVGQQSTLLTGSFATFRGNPESEDEVYVLTKNGTATHHNDFDEGGFTIWAYGAPAASDYGYHAEHEGRNYGVGDTWKHNCVEFDGKSSGYLGIEKTSPPEKWVSTELADLLVSYLPITNLRSPHFDYMHQIPVQRIEYRRYTLFVKPHYLLVFDSILDCKYSHKWWLHAQATDVEIDGPRVRFAGKFGVDLLAHFIAPAAPQIEVGEWSVMKHISALQAGAKDWRVFVAPAKPGMSFSVTSAEMGRVINVETPEYRDTIMLAHFPFEYAGSGIDFAGRCGVVRTAGGKMSSQLLDGERLRVR